MARLLRRRRRRPGPGQGALPADEAAGAGAAPSRSTSPPPSRRPTSTPSRPTPNRGSPATSTRSAGSAPTSAGTRPPWWCGPTRRSEGIGGHLSTYASSAALYEVGFNHFFRGKADGGFGDQVYFQGHASPGIYARAFVEGRLTEEQLDHFRQDASGAGLPSYPHPRTLPDFWEFPTVSMGLGPIAAIYQAHVNRYLHLRRLVDTSASRVWCFVGDGEMDEPESIGALGVAGREHLDNLIFVVNCNLQRLDGPVRGNGKIIQELEALFRGAGWNVIKVIWGSRWDALLAKDVDGVLLDRMNTTVDGEYQKLATESGAYIREHFFGPDPRLRKMVEDLSDDELVSLPRGGHDYRKLYAAYKLATEQRGAPTVILAKTIKGWTLGPEIEARNATHQIKKMTKAQLRALRDRLYLTDDIPDAALEGDPPYVRPAEGSDAMEYLRARGRVLDGPLPGPGGAPCAHRSAPTPRCSRSSPRGRANRRCPRRWCSPACCATSCATRPSGRSSRPSSRTRPAPSGSRRSSPRRRSTRPKARTTCRSTPTCRSTTPRARRARCSRRGSPRRARCRRSSPWRRPTPPGASPWCPCTSSIPCSDSSVWATCSGCSVTCAAAASWPAARRGGRRSWAKGSSTTTGSRPCSPRPTRPPWSTTPPSPTRWPSSWRRPSRRCSGPAPRDRFWYLTLYNETYPMPPLPTADADAVRKGIVDGLYRFSAAPEVGGTTRCGRRCASRARCGAWPSRRSRCWPSATAWPRTPGPSRLGRGLRTDALEVERWNRLHPDAPPRAALVTSALGKGPDPVVAITDYMRARAGPGVALRRTTLRLARHGRLRPLRRPRGLADALRGRRGPPRRRRAPAAGAERAGGARARGQGHRRSRACSRRRCRPSGCDRGHERGQHLLRAVGHRQAQA